MPTGGCFPLTWLLIGLNPRRNPGQGGSRIVVPGWPPAATPNRRRRCTMLDARRAKGVLPVADGATKGNLIWLNAPCLVQIYPILNKFRKNIACK
jgi:hypothetical protein